MKKYPDKRERTKTPGTLCQPVLYVLLPPSTSLLVPRSLYLAPCTSLLVLSCTSPVLPPSLHSLLCTSLLVPRPVHLTSLLYLLLVPRPVPRFRPPPARPSLYPHLPPCLLLVPRSLHLLHAPALVPRSLYTSLLVPRSCPPPCLLVPRSLYLAPCASSLPSLLVPPPPCTSPLTPCTLAPCTPCASSLYLAPLVPPPCTSLLYLALHLLLIPRSLYLPLPCTSLLALPHLLLVPPSRSYTSAPCTTLPCTSSMHHPSLPCTSLHVPPSLYLAPVPPPCASLHVPRSLYLLVPRSLYLPVPSMPPYTRSCTCSLHLLHVPRMCLAPPRTMYLRSCTSLHYLAPCTSRSIPLVPLHVPRSLPRSSSLLPPCTSLHVPPPCTSHVPRSITPMYLAPCTLHHVPCTSAPCTSLLVPRCTSSSLYLAPCTAYVSLHVSLPIPQAPVNCLAPYASLHVPRSMYLAPCTARHTPHSLFLAPCTRSMYCPCTSHSCTSLHALHVPRSIPRSIYLPSCYLPSTCPWLPPCTLPMYLTPCTSMYLPLYCLPALYLHVPAPYHSMCACLHVSSSMYSPMYCPCTSPMPRPCTAPCMYLSIPAQPLLYLAPCTLHVEPAHVSRSASMYHVFRSCISLHVFSAPCISPPCSLYLTPAPCTPHVSRSIASLHVPPPCISLPMYRSMYLLLVPLLHVSAPCISPCPPRSSMYLPLYLAPCTAHLLHVLLPLWSVTGVTGRSTDLPCYLNPRTPGDRPKLILWYKKDVRTPVFSHDGRVPQMRSDIRQNEEPPHSLEVRDSEGGMARGGILGPYREGVSVTFVCTAKWHPICVATLAVDKCALVKCSGKLVRCKTKPNPSNLNRISLSPLIGSPSPNVTWWRNNEQLSDSWYLRTPGQVVNELKVEKLARDWHNTSVTCVAANTHLANPVSIDVNVQMFLLPTSVVISNPGAVREGQQVRLVCTSTGSRPSASLSWTVRGVTRPAQKENLVYGDVTSSTLVTNLTRKDHNTRWVKVMFTSTTRGALSFSLHNPPTVAASLGRSLRPELLKEGDDVYFTCTVEANPPASTITWYHEGAQVQNVTQGVILAGESLVLQKVGRRQAGQYTCAATNTITTTTSPPVTLRIKYKPVCLTSPTTYFIYDKPINVTCSVTSYPPVRSIQWQWNSSSSH
ncbi:B-cell receptor CD22-like [Homarus americanus]|uniref:B-cell receptor CD22-like n=1 Tax=Homarus americanus TaxID=6706 RepID=A0A8J5K9P7_HOMAM|nr:B-cell receptor CD22-like [Homarus americanus]